MGSLRAILGSLRKYWPTYALGFVWSAVLVGLLIWGLAARANARTDPTRCRPQPAVSGIPATTPTQPAQLKPRTEPRSAVAFYQDRTVTTRRSEYDITDPGHALGGNTKLDVSVGPFLSTANSRQLNQDDINAIARVERSRVILDVCFNRTDPHFGSPGTYSGVVTITDPRVTLTDVSYTVTMSYPWWQLVVAVLVAMLLPAVLYLWFLRGSFTSHPGLTASLIQDWIFSRVTLMSLGAGVAAAVGIFSAAYAHSEAWGTDYTAATALFGATFSAFVAAATGVTAAGSDSRTAQLASEPNQPPPRTEQPPGTPQP